MPRARAAQRPVVRGHRPEPATQRRQEDRRDEECGRVEPERQCRAHHEQGRAERRREQVVADELHAHQSRVRPRQLLGGHDGRQQRRARFVGERLHRADHEEGDVHEGDGRRARRDGDGEPADDRGPDQVGQHDDVPPIEAVDVDAGREREQQPRHLLHEHRARDERRVGRQGREQQWACRERHASPTLETAAAAHSRPKADPSRAPRRRTRPGSRQAATRDKRITVSGGCGGGKTPGVTRPRRSTARGRTGRR